MFWKRDKHKRRRYPEINTGDWVVTLERTDGHGFWSMAFEADPRLYAKISKLAWKYASPTEEFLPNIPSGQRTTPML